MSRVASENEVKIQIILSRKGADSSTGPGIGASPVFDDGSFVSIPIPYSHSPVKYSDIQFQKSEPRLSGLIEQLFGNEFAETPAHLDPDLVFASRRDRHKKLGPCLRPGEFGANPPCQSWGRDWRSVPILRPIQESFGPTVAIQK